jgi:hypothetical protein
VDLNLHRLVIFVVKKEKLLTFTPFSPHLTHKQIPPREKKPAGDKLFPNGYKMEKIFLLSFDFFSMPEHYEKQFFFHFRLWSKNSQTRTAANTEISQITKLYPMTF